MATPLKIEPVDATFGAVVTGFRIPEIDDDTFQALHAAWLKYALLIFPGQHLTRAEQIAFAKRFGPLEFEMTAISNVKEDGTLRLEKDNDDRMKILKGNMGWHCDSTYMPVQAKGAVFCAEEVPTIGGHTGFADMRAAYDALDEATRAKVETLSAHHSLHYSQSKLGHDSSKAKADGEYSGYGFHNGPVPRRQLVKVHPETGRKSLMVGQRIRGILGLSDGESAALLGFLNEHAQSPEFIYRHRWSVHDLVMWDNRCTQHIALPDFDQTQPRLMLRCSLEGEVIGRLLEPGKARVDDREALMQQLAAIA